MTFRFSQVAICKDSVVELVDLRNPTQRLIKGNLQVLIEISTGMLMFKMEDFSYGINPNDKVIYEDRDPDFKMLLCLDSGQDKCWILKINDNVQLICFVLSERCKLIHRKASKIIVQQINSSERKMTPLQEERAVEANYMKFKDLQQSNKEEEEREKEVSSSVLLVEASKSLSKGIAKAGQFLAKGLEMLGSFLSKNVEPTEAVTLSEETKKLLKQSADGSKKILQITTEQFSALFRIAKKETEKLVDKFESSQKGKEMIENGNYTGYKKKFLTGIHIIANIYEGITQGISQAGNGLAKGTTQVVGAKYGKEAGEATGNIIEGTRNVYKIMDAPYNVAVNQFKPTQAVIKKL